MNVLIRPHLTRALDRLCILGSAQNSTGSADLLGLCADLVALLRDRTAAVAYDLGSLIDLYLQVTGERASPPRP